MGGMTSNDVERLVIAVIYEITLNQSYFGQRCVNRWNYITPSTGGGVESAVQLANLFGADNASAIPVASTILAGLRAIQAGGVGTDSVFVRAVYDTTDFYEVLYPTPYMGTATGEGQSPVLSYAARTSREDLAIRRGYKRFVGVTEGTIGPGGVLTAPTLTALDTVCTRMEEILSVGASDFIPAILKKEAYTTPSGRTAYRYFDTEDEQRANLYTIGNWSGYTTVRTQISRQYGRGA